MRTRERTYQVLSMLAAILVTGSLAIAASSAPRPSPRAIPASTLGPRATTTTVARSSSYGLFTCQLGPEQDEPVNCYDPYQMRHAYGTDALIAEGWTGAGKTIVIVDAFQNPVITQQLLDFDAFYSIPDPVFSIIAPDGSPAYDPTNGDMVNWAVEISLDVEWAHAIAPGAKIVLVLAKSDADADIYSALKYAVDNRLGDIISQSFGEDESCMDPTLVTEQHQVYANATKKGMTIFASSGDFGSAQINCAQTAFVQAVSIPASDPLVTAVGGTDLDAAFYCFAVLGCNPAQNPSPGTYLGEVVWNETDIGAGGGGYSVLYDEPSYQKGTLHGGKQEGVPDVSYNAAVFHGVLTLIEFDGLPDGPGWYLVGGTSAGSPQWSAITAIADQKKGSALGFINKALYHIAQAPPHYSASFHDITVGNNSFAGVPGFSAAPGWDPASGIGSPKAPEVVDYLIQFVSPGDGQSAIAQSAHNKGGKGGHMKPH